MTFSFRSFFAVLSPTQNKPLFTPPVELRTSLEEHQSALELIMTKYREQVFRLLMASKRDNPTIMTQLKEQHTTVSKDQLLLLVPINFGSLSYSTRPCPLNFLSILLT